MSGLVVVACSDELNLLNLRAKRLEKKCKKCNRCKVCRQQRGINEGRGRKREGKKKKKKGGRSVKLKVWSYEEKRQGVETSNQASCRANERPEQQRG